MSPTSLLVCAVGLASDPDYKSYMTFEYENNDVQYWDPQ